MTAFITKSVFETFAALKCGACHGSEDPGEARDGTGDACRMCDGNLTLPIPDAYIENTLREADKTGAFDSWYGYNDETWSIRDFERAGIVEELVRNTIDIEFDYSPIDDGEDGFEITEVTLVDNAGDLEDLLTDERTRDLFVASFTKEFQEVAADHWAEVKLEQQYPTD